MKKLQLISTLMVLLISIVTIIYVLQDNMSNQIVKDQVSTVTNEIVQSVEPIVLQDLANSNNISINFADKPTVILFFTSWCPYCNNDAPKIVQLNNKYKNDLNLYGINLISRDDIQDVRDFTEKYYIEYPILLDESGSIYQKYGGSGFPSLYFFNSKGEVIDQIIGSTDIATIESSFLHLIDNF
ncbi:TlpA family protein disulfide reductase [Paenibacillus macquariensis]|uniref:Thiol-disulfide isomerase or thioredoxin n=1 Tax=Paenibacillus macquariensis TaxID=948756 RepID=A0ABY1JMH5_9BACL|nr:TlpA disulfide reductase family protein [Paenibacillus macquariensis]MEC0092318.1 TlpA disulfide reductase family protein [Paenibacillus macquariensis]SIQ46287.1 Thiol-disulfide isomerase or thioredoxin [Paenibacillus macquariensis]